MSPGGLEHGKQTASWSFGGYCTLIVSDWELMIELRTRRMGGLGPVCCSLVLRLACVGGRYSGESRPPRVLATGRVVHSINADGPLWEALRWALMLRINEQLVDAYCFDGSN